MLPLYNYTLCSFAFFLTLGSPLTETARHRRRTRLRRQLAQKSESETISPQSAGARPLPELSDTTTRIANLLQEKLKSDDNDAALTPVRSPERVEGPQASVTAEDREHSAAATGNQSEKQ